MRKPQFVLAKRASLSGKMVCFQVDISWGFVVFIRLALWFVGDQSIASLLPLTFSEKS